MLARNVAALAVALLAAAAVAPIFLIPQVTPGNPDDVAELLPADTAFFLEIVRGPRVFNDWKEYVGAVCTPEGKKKACEAIEKAVKEALDIVPERLLKDLEKGLPSIQRLAAAITPPGKDGRPGWAILATSSDPAFFRRIVEEDLKVFAREERKHPAATVLVIGKLGEMKFPEPLLVASPGSRLVLTTDEAAMRSVLDRAAGTLKTDDLRRNALYGKFSAPTGDAPAIRAFAQMPWDWMMGSPRASGVPRRYSIQQMDLMSAVVDFRKITGTTLEATLAPGRIVARSQTHVEGVSRLFEAFKQPAGPKDLLRHVSSDAALAAHVNLKGGKAVWEDIRGFIRRFEEVQKRTPGGPQGEGSFEEQIDKELEREVGFRIEDLAAVLGEEIAFAMVGADVFASEENAVASLLFLVKLADPDKGRAIIEKIVAKDGKYEKSKEGDATLWISPQAQSPCFAVDGKVGILAFKPDTLKAALKMPGGANLATGLPADAASSSYLVSVQHRALWSLAAEISRNLAGGGVPLEAKDFDLDARTTVLIRHEAGGIVLSSTDAGLGLAAQLVVTAAPAGLALAMGRGEKPEAVAAEKPVPPVAEPAALSRDKLAEEVRKALADLRADELATREAGSAGLLRLGKQAVPLIAEAARAEKDVDVRQGLFRILQEHRAYDAFPELAHAKADAFLRDFTTLVADAAQNPYGGFAVWPRQEGMPFPWPLEPQMVQEGMLAGMESRDALEVPLALASLAARVNAESLPPHVRVNLAAVLAWSDCGAASEALLAAHAAATHPEVKTYLQIALGWSDDAKAREAVLKGFSDGDVWARRASFLAAERSRDPAVVARLVELLRSEDAETRWNASYVLRLLTRDRVSVNVYLPEGEVKAAIAAAEKWWAENRATFRIERDKANR
jgi:hypothetical protein